MTANEPILVDELEAEGFEPPPPPPGQSRIRVDDEDETPSDTENPLDPESLPVTELTDEERAQFRDLLTVGRRSRTFELFEHTITVCTLNTDDEIRVFRACRDDENTAAFPRAYQTAYVAAALRTIDGVSVENTLTENPGPEVVFEQKLAKVRGYYFLVVQAIYKEVLTAEQEFAELARKLGKL